MSYYDPYYLYTHPQRHSHKGQVIQKRPVKVDYAANQDDLRRALQIVKGYGYTISKTPIINAEFSIYGGVINKDTINLRDIINADGKTHLQRYNPNIFDNPHKSIKLLVNINTAILRYSGSFNYPINFRLVDGTTFTASQTTPGIAIHPYSSTQLWYNLGTLFNTFARGRQSEYNNGVLFTESEDIAIYEGFQNNDYSRVPDTELGSLTSTYTHDTYWNYTIVIILD